MIQEHIYILNIYLNRAFPIGRANCSSYITVGVPVTAHPYRFEREKLIHTVPASGKPRESFASPLPQVCTKFQPLSLQLYRDLTW